MRNILLIVLLLTGSTTYAQQDALFSQYMFNKLVLNPAYTGTRDALSITLLGRHQWVSLDGAPRTATFSIHSPLHNDKVGLGLYGYTDGLGPLQTTGAVGSFSYKVRMGPGKLSFGLQFGFKHMKIDWNKVKMHDEGDIFYFGDEGNDLVADANFGLYYYTGNYYFGLSSKQLIEQSIGTRELSSEVISAILLRHFYGMAGVAITLNDDLVLKPSVLAKYVKNAPFQMDLNVNLLIRQVLWLGLSYRTEGTLVLLTELQVNERMRIGYSYDASLNKIHYYNKGSHELLIGFDLPVFKHRMLTPRYF